MMNPPHDKTRSHFWPFLKRRPRVSRGQPQWSDTAPSRREVSHYAAMNHTKRLAGRPFKLGAMSVRVCTIYVFTDVLYTAREHSGRSGVLPRGCVCAAGCVSAYVFDAATLSGDNESGGEKNWEENRWNAGTQQSTQNRDKSHKDVPISQPPLTVDGSRIYWAVRD